MEQMASSTKNNAENTRLASTRASDASASARKVAIDGAGGEKICSPLPTVRAKWKILSPLLMASLFRQTFSRLMLLWKRQERGITVKASRLWLERSGAGAPQRRSGKKYQDTDCRHHRKRDARTVVSEAEQNMHEIVSGASVVSKLMDEIAVSTVEQEKAFRRSHSHCPNLKKSRRVMSRWSKSWLALLTF
jgi:hypothetical protein